jgi:hypothetical protein
MAAVHAQHRSAIQKHPPVHAFPTLPGVRSLRSQQPGRIWDDEHYEASLGDSHRLSGQFFLADRRQSCGIAFAINMKTLVR